jgi:hypothetical protein
MADPSNPIAHALTISRRTHIRLPSVFYGLFHHYSRSSGSHKVQCISPYSLFTLYLIHLAVAPLSHHLHGKGNPCTDATPLFGRLLACTANTASSGNQCRTIDPKLHLSLPAAGRNTKPPLPVLPLSSTAAPSFFSGE